MARASKMDPPVKNTSRRLQKVNHMAGLNRISYVLNSLPYIFNENGGHLESHGNRQGFIEKMFQQIETQLKQTQITPVGAMGDSYPAVSFGYDTQINDPNVSQTSGYQQAGNPLWVKDMALLQMEATTFLVGEKGFNAKSFPVSVTSFFSQSHIGDQINRLFGVPTPPSHDENRTIFVLSNEDIRQRETITWLEKNLLQGKLVAIVVYQTVLGSATNVFPTIIGNVCLELVAIKLPVSQKDDITFFWQQGLERLNQLAVRFRENVPCCPG
jgi:hypothetical protein